MSQNHLEELSVGNGLIVVSSPLLLIGLHRIVAASSSLQMVRDFSLPYWNKNNSPRSGSLGYWFRA